ncbi:hypothetical protein RJ640_028147, partial [Escallonia rubra]
DDVVETPHLSLLPVNGWWTCPLQLVKYRLEYTCCPAACQWGVKPDANPPPTVHHTLFFKRSDYIEKMSDWGPVFIAVVLFILLTPGLLFQMPGHGRCIEFGNFRTSGLSILVHAILYFAFICIFLLAVGVHVYIG